MELESFFHFSLFISISAVLFTFLTKFSSILTKFSSILQKYVKIVNCSVKDFISKYRELFDPSFLAKICAKNGTKFAFLSNLL